METINPLTERQSNLPTSAATLPVNGDEFNNFLRLLTAQIRNQDPLAPLDSTEFVTQLATFSSLEQQVRSNSSLEFIATVLNDMQTMLASEWLGQTVSIESSWVPYTGEEILFGAEIPGGTDRAILTVRGSDGEVAWTETLDLDDTSFSWDGRTQSGVPVSPDSLLEFSIEIFRDGTYAGSLAPRIITTVTGIGHENGKIRLGTSSHLSTDLGNIRKVEE